MTNKEEFAQLFNKLGIKIYDHRIPDFYQPVKNAKSFIMINHGIGIGGIQGFFYFDEDGKFLEYALEE